MGKEIRKRPTQFTSGLQVGGVGSKYSQMKTYTPSLTPAAVAANTTAEQTFAVSGLKAGDIVLACLKPTAQAGLGIVGYRVSLADTLAITFSNNTAAPITPTAAQQYTVVVLTQ